jgi:hypothetical protein
MSILLRDVSPDPRRYWLAPDATDGPLGAGAIVPAAAGVLAELLIPGLPASLLLSARLQPEVPTVSIATVATISVFRKIGVMAVSPVVSGRSKREQGTCLVRGAWRGATTPFLAGRPGKTCMAIYKADVKLSAVSMPRQDDDFNRRATIATARRTFGSTLPLRAP